LNAPVHAVLNCICRTGIWVTAIADLKGIGKALILLHDEIDNKPLRYLD
jgi:hypothetical protein